MTYWPTGISSACISCGMTAVKEMEESCRCNSLILVGFGLFIVLALIIIQCSTVVQLQTMKAEVTFVKEQMQQQQQTRDDDVTQTLSDRLFQVSTC